jgi:magnesium transporter
VLYALMDSVVERYFPVLEALETEFENLERLAGYASLVAIPTMIAGIYGMNFKHMPELDWGFGYPLAIGAMVAIDGYLFYRFRKAGWI